MGITNQLVSRGPVQCPMCAGKSTVILDDLRDVEDRTGGGYGIACCQQCEFAFLVNEPVAEATASLYPSCYHALRNRQRGMALRRLLNIRFGFRVRRLRRYGIADTNDVLEVGCGDGSFLEFLAGHWPRAGRLVGFDAGIKVPTEASVRPQLLRGTAENISIDGKFDVVVAYDVMEHLTRPLDRLRTIRSWLRPGGRLVVQVPNWESYWRRMFPRHWAGLQVPRHRSFFTEASLKAAVESAGFVVRHWGPVFDPGDLSVSLCNWIADRIQMKTKPRDVWFYTPLALLCVPVVGIQFVLLGLSGEVEIVAEVA